MTRIEELPYWPALLASCKLPRAMVKEIIYQWCVAESRSLADLFELSRTELEQRFSLDEGQIQQLHAAQAAASEWGATLDGLAQEQVYLLTRDDPAYPEPLVQRLGELRLPYYLFLQGNVALLAEPTLSILGGSQPTPLGEEVTRDLAERLAAGGYQLLGNYARGVDRTALDTARRAQGPAVILLPLGIEAFRSVGVPLDDGLRAGRLLVTSPYTPQQPYTLALGSASLGLITAWSEAICLVEPDVSPEDWPNIEKAIDGQVLFLVWTGGTDEITESWIEAGALPFGDATSASASLNEVLGLPPAIVDADEDGQSIDDLAGVEPISFADAEEAIEALGRGGRVPAKLAERLRNSEWPGDIEVFDLDTAPSSEPTDR